MSLEAGVAIAEGERTTPTQRTADRFRTGRGLRRALAVSRLVDVAVLTFAVLLAWNLRFFLHVWDFSSGSASASNLYAAPAIVALWMIVLVANRAYSVRYLAEGAEEYAKLAYASFLAASLTCALCYLFHVPLARGFVLLTFVLGTPLLLLARFMVRQTIYSLRRTGRMLHRVVAVGGALGVSEVVDALRRSQYVGYRVVGACIPADLEMEPERLPVPTLGRVHELRDVCDDVGADTVLVARGGFSTARELRRIAWQLEGSDIELIVVPSVTDVAGPRVQMRPVAGLPLVHLEEPQAAEALGADKRAFDVFGALAALLLLSPVMLVVAALIWFEDRGPIFFKQARIGQDGTEFGCYKFRSMFVNAQEMEAKLRADSGHEGALWKMENDPRITRIGSVIRRFSIDELPQLLNVVRGEMSLVGPRPQQAWEVATYTDWEDRRLRVRPGMTGLWQVSGRSQLSFDEAIRLDLYYVDNWSMVSDLVIMAKTVKAVFGSAGAY
jgi:exopolysaccharide biosynthesis polyprenyl glycosylphosphotransferase